jgi:hypothetical protein
MHMHHIQLGERGRGGQVKYADGHYTKTFLQSLIKYYGENILQCFEFYFPYIVPFYKIGILELITECF